MKYLRHITTASVVVLLSVLMLVPPAHPVSYMWEGAQKGADSGQPSGFRNPSMGIGQAWGRGFFYGDEDEFYLLDMEGDGMRIGVEWRVTTGSQAGRWGLCYNVRGSGGGTLGGARYAKCNKAISAGHVIMRLGRCDGTVHPCQKPGSGSGWTDWTAWRDGDNDAYNRAVAGP